MNSVLRRTTQATRGYTMKKSIKLPTMPMKEFDRRADAILQEIQKNLLPEHASDFVAINVETGEYVVGPAKEEVRKVFRQRWPGTLPFLARVDGQPTIKFYGR